MALPHAKPTCMRARTASALGGDEAGAATGRAHPSAVAASVASVTEHRARATRILRTRDLDPRAASRASRAPRPAVRMRETPLDDGHRVGADAEGRQLAGLDPANVGRVIAGAHARVRPRRLRGTHEVLVDRIRLPFARDRHDAERRDDAALEGGFFA